MGVRDETILVAENVSVLVDRTELFWMLEFGVRWALKTEDRWDTRCACELIRRYASRLERAQVDTLVARVDLRVFWPKTPRHRPVADRAAREQWAGLLAWLRAEGFAS